LAPSSWAGMARSGGCMRCATASRSWTKEERV
jgi:hypothetical protein